jgi:hypothetical protein
MALNGLSLIEHIDGKDKKALEIAEEAVQKSS